jgi:hypothetical protein
VRDGGRDRIFNLRIESCMSKNGLSNRIEKHQYGIHDKGRGYIGASNIGSPCLRQIWYEFKGVNADLIPPKMRRAWEIGNCLESLILDWIEQTGLTIDREWEQLQSKNVPLFKGHLDSVWVSRGQTMKNAIAIIEIKTAKDSNFNLFVKNGLKKWSPQYYAQIQSYMGMSGIYTTYIFVLNKDNSNISDEKVHFDEAFYESLEEKARLIESAAVPPPKINGSPSWYLCKMCKFNKVCHS